MTQEISPRNHTYLKPSTLWSLRQGFPKSWGRIISICSIVIPLIAWTIASYTKVVSELFLPSPLVVLQTGIKMLLEENLWSDIMISCGRVIGGFLVGGVIGVPMGLAMGTFHSMENLFAPIVGLVRYMPVPALMPLIIIWFNIGEVSKIVVIMLGVVLYNAMMIADAVKFIPNDMINVAYTLGGTRRDVVTRVILPATLPSVLDTLRVNIANAWTFLVIAELIGTDKGLGAVIIRSQRFLHPDKVLFCIGLMGVIGLGIDYGLRWISTKVTPWADQTRH
ncbi:MAG: ABC transporter permease [Alkalinema sp. RL_2_19]|nr:ABC transporter permease [Alkalinema sp. RL_2_19]